MLEEPVIASPNAIGALRSYPSVDSTAYPYRGLSHDVIDYKIERNKKEHVGLCMNNLCSSRAKKTAKAHFAKHTKGFMTKDKRMIDCPTCKTALFWSNNFNERWV